MAIATVNPATGKAEMIIEPHSPEEVEQRITEAAEAWAVLRQTSIAQRAEWMRAAAAILDDDAEGLGELITIEMGKPIAQSVAEVHKCAKAMRFYADNSEEFLADVQLDDPAVVSASRAWTRYEPLGVILAVMPWNYPLWQVIRFAAPALMAGNTGLLKHASNVPQSALFLDTLVRAGRLSARILPRTPHRRGRSRRSDRRPQSESGHAHRLGTGGPLGGGDRR